MWSRISRLFPHQGNSRKSGFGIIEIMVSIVVLGFLYVALGKLQVNNVESFKRIRDRDGAVEVAQQVLDELKAKGAAALPSSSTEETVFTLDTIVRRWQLGSDGETVVPYVPTVTVLPTQNFTAESGSNYQAVEHVYAKQVTISVQWSFKGSSNQSIKISGVVR